MTTTSHILVGQFTGAHGVRGLVKLRSFTAQPDAIFDYAPLTGADGRPVYKITAKSNAKTHFIVAVAGVENKEQADQLRGDKIFTPRAALPKTRKGEFYEGDLIGLTATDAAGKNYGQILAIHDHGAGVFVEIGTTRKDSFMLPFRDAFVPVVDMKGGKVIVAVPEGWV